LELSALHFQMILSKIPKYKELSHFFGMAKVMENLIRQNFEMNIFSQFSTGFTTITKKPVFSATITGFPGDVRGNK